MMSKSSSYFLAQLMCVCVCLEQKNYNISEESKCIEHKSLYHNASIPNRLCKANTLAWARTECIKLRPFVAVLP